MVFEGDSESMALVPVEDADGSVHGSTSGEPSIPSREALELADSILEERFDTSDFDRPDAILHGRREVGKMVFEKAVASGILLMLSHCVGGSPYPYSDPSWVLKMPHCL